MSCDKPSWKRIWRWGLSSAASSRAQALHQRWGVTGVQAPWQAMDRGRFAQGRPLQHPRTWCPLQLPLGPILDDRTSMWTWKAWGRAGSWAARLANEAFANEAFANLLKDRLEPSPVYLPVTMTFLPARGELEGYRKREWKVTINLFNYSSPPFGSKIGNKFLAVRLSQPNQRE